MALSKIKDIHKQTTVAFGSSGLPLGMRTDTDDLAIMAHESGDKTLLAFFEYLPPLADLKKAKLEASLSGLNLNRVTLQDTQENGSKTNDSKESSKSETGSENSPVGSGNRRNRQSKTAD